MEKGTTIGERLSERSKVIQAIEKSLEIQSQIEEIIELTWLRLKEGNAVYTCGNGGSAAEAQHLAAELSGRFYKSRKALKADFLSDNTAALTAIANDYGYNQVFSRMLEALSQPGDVLWAFSTSGSSVNILMALEYANRNGMYTIGFGSVKPNAMKDLCTCFVEVPSNDTAIIQEMHLIIGHLICEKVEQMQVATEQ